MTPGVLNSEKHPANSAALPDIAAPHPLPHPLPADAGRGRLLRRRHASFSPFLRGEGPAGDEGPSSRFYQGARQKTCQALQTLVPALALAAGIFATQPARAELNINLSGGNFQPMKIAVTECAGETAAAGVSAVITSNLRRSGAFDPVAREQQPDRAPAFDAAPDFAAWAKSGAQALVLCRLTDQGGRMRAEYRLYDLTAGEQLTGQQYTADQPSWRRIAHLISDSVFTRITGEKGFFDTRIVYVDESGPKDKRRKRLAIIDQDGANFRALTSGGSLAVTPRFSPTSQEVAYMGFADGSDPKVYLLDVARGQREAVGNFPGMSFSPRFSPDGGKIVMSLQQGGNSNIYVMSLATKQLTRLTSGAAIDTSPSYAPDGGRIVFESDRGGNQQLYLMAAGGGEAKRISFGEGRYSTPVWSPKGDYIAFTKLKGGSFAIGIIKPDGSGERILTEGFHNEGPTWRPTAATSCSSAMRPAAAGQSCT